MAPQHLISIIVFFPLLTFGSIAAYGNPESEELRPISIEEAEAIIRLQREAVETKTREIKAAIASVPALDERVITTKDRHIIVRRVDPQELPPSVEPSTESASTVATASPELMGEADEKSFESISLGANVFGDQYSEITWRDTESGEAFTVWTNVSLAYLQPVSVFEDDNTRYDYFGFITFYDYRAELERIEQATELGCEVEMRWKEPPVTFSNEYYEYVVTGDAVNVPEKLYRQLDALFAYYLANEAELEIQYKNAQTMEVARKKDLAENPPIPSDSVTNFWPGENSVYLKEDK